MNLRSVIAMSLVTLTCLVALPTQLVAADNCPVIDYATLNLEKAPAANWKNGSAVRVITWSSTEVSLDTDAVSTQFSTTEQASLQEVFDSYGEILDSVAFQKSPRHIRQISSSGTRCSAKASSLQKRQGATSEFGSSTQPSNRR